MSVARTEIVILGAGPTGLGAAWRLAELGHRDWTVLEAAAGPGGLAASFGDGRGFTWDLGAHVLHSHYDYFDRVMDEVLDDWIEHERRAWIWMRDRFVPYPLQHNLHRLPADDLERCLAGLAAVDGRAPHAHATFAGWLYAAFGPGIAELFLRPYNAKVWGHAPELLTATWVGDRVAPIDVARVRENVARRRDDVGWGPNSRFRFPARGGTGEIWDACARRLPAERLRFRRPVVAIDFDRRTVTTACGETVGYAHLVSTLPLPELLALGSEHDRAATARAGLLHTTTHVVGVGLAGTVPPRLADKSWIYFPEGDCPFHRIAVFSNYTRGTVPADAPHWSLIAEVTESEHRPLADGDPSAQVVAGLLATGMIARRTDVVALRHVRVPYGYPVPGLARDAVLADVLPFLEHHGVSSRGRFGLWKYEVSNQDHAFMQGVEVVERLLHERPEITAYDPNHANATKHPWPFARWTATTERSVASRR